MKRIHRISGAGGALPLIACAALWLAGCRAAGAVSPAPRLAGVVRCAGGSTMLPLVERWGQEFHALHPQAMVETDPRISLAAGGFRELLDGQVDLVDFVREPFPAEIAAFRRKFGYVPLLVNVANGSFDTRGGTHAIAIYVNSSNPLRHLTLGQLDEILSAAPRHGSVPPIGTWGGVGLQGKWAARPIHVYGMAPLRPSGNPPGIVNFMEIRVLQGGTFRTDLRVERDRQGTSALKAIVRAVADDPDGIGYSGFGYALPGVKTIALAEHPGEPYVEGGAQRVADRSYPLSRQIYFALNSPPGHPLAPLIKAFIELALSPEGQRRVAATPDHFLPLTPAQSTRSRLLIGQTAPAGRVRAASLHRTSHVAAAVPSRSAGYLTANRAISIVGYNDMREML
ncbi:MAG: PstS family phosphate ABC transporter substrate-binding protein, partial [Sciscionella sp.]